MKRGQISTEYMILIGFILFLVTSMIGMAFVYVLDIKDSVKFNQVEKFADKLISSAESVFYSGEPSKITINLYLPEGIENIQIINQDVVFTISSNSGQNIIAYESNVPIQGTISPNPGLKKIVLTANANSVVIS